MSFDAFRLFQLKQIEIESLTKGQILATASVAIAQNLYFVAMGMCTNFLFAALDFNRYVNFSNRMLLLLSIFCHFEFTTSFMMLLSCGYYQLLAMNNHLKRCVKSQIESPAEEVIRKTRIMYDKLCDIFESISVFYLISNLVFLMALIFYSICFHYTLYIYGKNPSEDLGYFVLTTFVWCTNFAPCIIWITIFSSWIESEGKKTADLVQKLANKDRNLKSLNTSILMILLTAHRKQRVFCGMYDFNWKGFFAMTCSIFSLSIIVIQFYDVSNE